MKKEKTIMKVSCEEVEAHLKKCGKHFYGITEKYKKEIREEALEEFEKNIKRGNCQNKKSCKSFP